MCGICGYLSANESIEDQQDLFEKMSSRQIHRGPDANDAYFFKYGFIANQRLAIIDVDMGNQPFFSDDKQVSVVQNGEIFNFIELRQQLKNKGYEFKTQSDTEVILNLYLDSGLNALSSLNGMFAIAIWDQRIEKLYLIRDRVGEKPLYFTNNAKGFYFASEVKALLPALASKNISKQALKEYFAFNYVPPPLTLFEQVLHVMPGCYLEVSPDGAYKEKTWWDLSSISQAPLENLDEKNVQNELLVTLDDAVKLRTRSDVPFGAFLSGGVDSSSVVGLMAKHLGKGVKTYSIGFEDPRYDESEYAQLAAKRFATSHNNKIVTADIVNDWPKVTYYSDQPHGDVSFIPTMHVAELAATDVKMVLTGDGADELFAGYDKYSDFAQLEDSKECFSNRYAKYVSLFSENELSELLDDYQNENIVIHKLESFLDPVSDWDEINQALYFDTKLLLPGNNLVKPDKMGMMHSIENRAPFLDWRMVELSFSLPGKFKYRRGEKKYIFKKAVQDLIGAELAYRKKQMFTVPIGDWFTSSLKGYVDQILFDGKMESRSLVNIKFVKKMVSEHQEGTKNRTREIRALMSFELWCRSFLDQGQY